MENLTHLDTAEEPRNSKPLESLAVSLERLHEASKPLQDKRIFTAQERNNIPVLIVEKKLLTSVRYAKQQLDQHRAREFARIVAKYQGHDENAN